MFIKIKKFLYLYYYNVIKWIYRKIPVLLLERFKQKTFSVTTVTYEDVQLVIDLLVLDLIIINPHKLTGEFNTYHHSLTELEEVINQFLTCIDTGVSIVMHHSLYNNLFVCKKDDFLYKDALIYGYNFKERLINLGTKIIIIKNANNKRINRIISKCIYSYVSITKMI